MSSNTDDGQPSVAAGIRAFLSGRSTSERQLGIGHLPPTLAIRTSRPGQERTFDGLPESRQPSRSGTKGPGTR